jgi:hypothetical protein
LGSGKKVDAAGATVALRRQRMSEATNEPITLDIQFYDESDVLQFRTVSFTGESLDYYDDERVHAAFTLYRWLDKGYVVYVEDFKQDSKILYRDDLSGKGYTAEEVAKLWPRFANTVGITPGHDIDFDEPSP